MEGTNRWMHWELALLLALGLALTIPSLTRPIQNDDNGYILVARNVLSHPLSPAAGTLIFFGEVTPFMASTHSPLHPMMLASVIALAGWENPWLLHLALLPFVGIILAAHLALARRQVRLAWVPPLLLLLSPGFRVSAASLMTEIPVLAWALLGAVGTVRAVERHRPRSLILASLAFTLAVGTSYQSLLIPVTFALYLLLVHRRPGPALILMSGPLLLLVGWGLTAQLRHGGLGALTSLTVLDHIQRDLESTFLGGLSFAGGCSALAILWLVPLLRRSWVGPAVLVLGGAAAFRAGPGYGGYRRLVLAACCGAGASLVWLAARALLRWSRSPSTPESALEQALGAWILMGLLSLPIFPFVTVRYIMPIWAAGSILAWRLLESRIRQDRWAVTLALILAVVTGLHSEALRRVDHQAAQANQHLLEAVQERNPVDPDRLYFSAEFGTRYYLEPHRVPYLLQTDRQVEPGALLLLSRYEGHGIPDLLHQELRPAATFAGSFTRSARNPLRLHHPPARAGWYCHLAGLLPWAATSSHLACHDLYRFVDQELEEPAPEPVSGLEARTVIVGETPAIELAAIWPAGLPPGKIRWELTPGWTWDQPVTGDLEPRATLLRRAVPPGTPAGPRNVTARWLPRGSDQPAAHRTGSLDLPGYLLPALPRPEAIARLGRPPILNLTGILPPESLIRWTQPPTQHRVTELVLASFMGNSSEYPQGETVAHLWAIDQGGRVHRWPIRAGLETAEWGAHHPAVLMDHELAPILRTNHEPFPGGLTLPVHSYLARFPLPEPVRITHVAMEMEEGPASLTVESLLLMGE